MSLRHAVLATLLPGPQSGYDLAKKFDEVMRGAWYARRNQMYGELAKLTEAGFAEEVEEGPRGRRAYAVTPAGRAELRRWLVETEPDRTVRDETMLRALLVSTLDPEDALFVLEREETALRTELTGLRAFLAQQSTVEKPTDPMMLGLELRAGMLDAMLKWTVEAARRFRTAPTARG
ncbi:DNA-binding PadR family transcriptional regulator [Kibdelosporangium banguiense]|uniref:DNA-binding PadR family transcriptional regulator n=1 Tax=Kibdelosporangium banguiense TaxID=1365924 RepID=A0ABS4U2A0_9PSEU|nr:PadR family transcriptional regulator [Kibdelosporangium banguiense]MBP2330784.1 DNA-binding PadR family transcriptional regulator [Kibdelosporangium banguiense]